MFSFALIDCCDYFGFGLMTTIETHSRERSPRTMFCLNDCEYMKIMYVICGLRHEMKAKIAFVFNMLLVTSHILCVF